MSPIQLIPSPDILPFSFSWLHALLLLTFMLHILTMNLTVGMGIICTYYHIRRNLGVVEDISHSIPTLIAFTINLGIPFSFYNYSMGSSFM